MAKDGGRSTKIITALTFLALPASSLAGVQFKSYQTHSHILVAVDPSVTYSVDRIQKDGKVVGLRLTLNNLYDEVEDLSGSNDVRTDRVVVTKTKTKTGDGTKITYDFLLSEKAQKAGVDFFDYRNKVPSEIALDYWLKTQTTETAEKATKPQVKTLVPRKAGPSRAKKQEKPAAKIYAGCGQPLQVTTSGFAFWKIYHHPFGYRAYFKLMPADAGYKYPELDDRKGDALPSRSKELAHYRLAHKLYKEAKYALTLRTIDFFESQYVNSPLRPELDFLRASTLVQLSRLLRTDRYLDQALEIYRHIVLESPESDRGKASLAFIVQELMDRGTPIFALEYSLIGADKKDENDTTRAWVYRLASAEALFALGEYDRAERAYQLIIDQNNQISPEAAFRVGEVYAARKFWERAAIAFEKAIKTYPNDAGRFSTAYFNLAEAYFRLERYDESARVYKEFMKRFSGDDSAWAADLRLTELEQMKIKNPDPKKHEAIQELYENVVNRHPYTPGAMMSELRLARCYRGPGDSDRTRDFFVNFFNARELKKFENPLVDAAEVEVWMDLAEASFNLQIENYRGALNRADDYRPRLVKMPLGDVFRKIYSDSVTGLAAAYSQKDNEKELLALVEHYGDLVLKPSPVAYELAVAKARMHEGDLKGVAERLVLIEGRLGDATDKEKDWYHLLKARQGKLLGEKADKIMAELSVIRDSGELAFEKLDELAQSAIDKGDLRSAIAYDTQILDSSLAKRISTDRALAVSVRRVESLARQGNASEAARLASHAMLKYGAETQLTELQGRLRELRAQALYDSGQFRGAVEALDEILNNSPNHPRHSEFEFMRGKGLARLGRDNEAFETFRRLAQAANSDVWKKSAQAELDQLQWENKVSNIMKDKDRRSSQ